jgi:GT2 family glycosyltransferase/glycosyltransferase involved in cell wall biosynthesis
MRVLLVVHGFKPRALGGTELYAEAHARELASSHADTVLVLAREADATRPELTVREEARDGYRVQWINHTFRASTSIEDAWRAPHVAAALVPVIDAFAPDVAHIHHLTCLSTLLPSMLAARRVPVVLTLHDYWLMCHRGQLLDLDGRCCEGPGETGCKRCIENAAASPTAGVGPAVRAIRALERTWPRAGGIVGVAARAGARVMAAEDAGWAASALRTRHVRGEVLPHIELFLAPSAHMRDRFVRFGVPAERVRVSPYGLAPVAVTRGVAARSIAAPGDVPEPPRGADTAPLRIGFVGSLMTSKAPHVAMNAVARLPPGTATLAVIGAFVAYHGDQRYRAVLDRAAAHPAVTMLGAAAPEQIPEFLASLDVLVVPSVWEENSPIVIHEAFRAGVPVVASRVGGIAELVEHEVNGLLVESGDTSELAAALARLAADRALLERLRARIPAVRPLEQAVGEMRAAYADLRAIRNASRPSAGRVAAVVLHHGTPEETALTVRALRAADPPLFCVLVVNNDAHPGSLDLGTTGVPVEHLTVGRNLGFPGGMNVGIRAALDRGAHAVLLVNSDVVVPPGAVAMLARVLDANPEVGIVAPVVLTREQPDTIASLGIRFNRASGRMRNLGGGSRFARPAHPAWRPVDAVNGAIMLVSRDAIERAGVLDEAYFFSFEEIEFCLRAADRGLISAVTTEAVAYHRGGATLAAAAPARFYYAARNHLRLASGLAPRYGRAGSFARAIVVVGLNLAHAVFARGGRRSERLAATWRGVRDYVRGRFGPESSGIRRAEDAIRN